MRIQGRKIPAGHTVPEVKQVKVYHIKMKMTEFLKRMGLEFDMNALMVFG